MNRVDTGDTPDAGLSAADHVLGPPEARLTLVEYGDYECPACIQAEPLVRHLVDTEGHRLRFVFRHYPLVEVHPHAELAAEAAEAAAAQGKFWPMHHLLFAQRQHLDAAALAGYAETVGLDMLRYHGEMNDRIYTQRVQEHRRAGDRSGLRATPTFFLNDAVVDVSFGFEKLTEAVHTALKGR
ncbi:thioredoxin domain-containing protein [Rhodoferax sp.]|uniref:DsbA family protein n=1 Tax=Rhodoferax sp. TaxID=50421 RepID=UPI0025ECF0EA|nr:thioredoxin domain-containing protein [Rhodoferax sp.]